MQGTVHDPPENGLPEITCDQGRRVDAPGGAIFIMTVPSCT